MRRYLKVIRKSINFDKVKKKTKDIAIILLVYLFIISICLLIPKIIVGCITTLFIATLLFIIYSETKDFINRVKSNLEE
ncbi:hypothetical protein AM596_14980 [Clostridium perfringens CP4]|uniref:hypothetical protein n=1 Tax=Clostridium perfringens TaxID=1502 RepID=UPI00070786D5|nr:hypothetical protein [Clostridium perfringens]KQC91338.1 hypothetical protein AM596_14980 [Clostridium perfringens CP4]MBO3398572.1 hypothetical protein [Clostridium perfringens]